MKCSAPSKSPPAGETFMRGIYQLDVKTIAFQKPSLLRRVWLGLKPEIMRYIKVLLLLVLLPFAGCKSRIDNHQKKMAIVVSTLNNPWFVFLAQTAAAQAKALGYESKIFDSQNNTAVEADHFENAIASGYSAILFNPTDANGSVANVLKAKKAGVPVFCMDREVNSPDAATSQILSDSYSGCVDLGKYFVKNTHAKGNYVEILGIVADNNTWARSKGFHSVVDYYPGLKNGSPASCRL
jgi:ABC-type sugar transport system substrate-binding protein